MKNKHLTYEERHEIEDGLSKNYTITQIANNMGRNNSTISKEIRKHRFTRDNTTTRHVNSDLKEQPCHLLDKPPYVCNGCNKKRICKNAVTLYHASRAQREYEETLKTSREGIPLNKESFYELDKITSEAMKKGQHLYHIHQTNDLGVSLSTLYRYLNKGYLSASILDAPRVAKFILKNMSQRNLGKVERTRILKIFLKKMALKTGLKWIP